MTEVNTSYISLGLLVALSWFFMNERYTNKGCGSEFQSSPIRSFSSKSALDLDSCIRVLSPCVISKIDCEIKTSSRSFDTPRVTWRVADVKNRQTHRLICDDFTRGMLGEKIRTRSENNFKTDDIFLSNIVGRIWNAAVRFQNKYRFTIVNSKWKWD